MKKLKIILITLVVLSSVILFLIIIINKDKYKKGQEEDIVEITEGDMVNDEEDIEPEYYFYAKYCLDKYYRYLSIINKKDECLNYFEYSEQEYEELMNEQLKGVYKLFDEEYIKDIDIKEDNLNDKYSDRYNVDFLIDKIYSKEINDGIYGLFVYGREVNNHSKVSNSGFMIKIDENNMTYSLYEYDYMKKYNYLNPDNLNSNCFTNTAILKNNYNTFEYTSVNQEILSKEFFTRYKKELVYDLENAYELLDKKLKERKFTSFEKFEEYIKNTNRYSGIIDKYRVYNSSSYVEYICIDSNNKYYIFTTEDSINYSVLLDTYTVEIPEYIEKYESTNVQEKVVLNIDRFFRSINDGDYEFAYNLLSDSFKNNSYNTKEVFNEWVNNNLFQENIVKYNKFKNEGYIYIYDITITNSNEKNGKQIDMQIIMQLKEGTDFEISFSIE